MNGASQLHAALHGRLDRIGEVRVRIEHHPQVDERKVARESFARNHVVDHRKRERAHAAPKRIRVARVVHGADGRRRFRCAVASSMLA